jgi:hypothetical protein
MNLVCRMGILPLIAFVLICANGMPHVTRPVFALSSQTDSFGRSHADMSPPSGTRDPEFRDRGRDRSVMLGSIKDPDRPNKGINEIKLAQRSSEPSSADKAGERSHPPDKVWRSEELKILAIGMGVGDVDGDGKNEVVMIDPSHVYLYRFVNGNLAIVTEYSVGNLELKCVDVAKMRKQGPARIYVTAQNRGNVESFVLEYRGGKLVPVIQGSPYFLRVIIYPTHGPILLGQRKGLQKMYEGPIFRMEDKGDALEVQGRFGIPLKIPIFGFVVGDFVGNRKPLIAVYDKYDHLRIYTPAGKRLYVSQDYYGGSDVILRWAGPERRQSPGGMQEEDEVIFFRPRIMAVDLNGTGVYDILVTKHHSKTMRVMSRTKMLEEGQVEGLSWNGDTVEEAWATPKIQGMITDFAIDKLPGIPGRRLITLERKRTDWLSFLRSRSQVRAYDLKTVIEEGSMGRRRREISH